MATPYDLYLHSLTDEGQSTNGYMNLYAQGDRPFVSAVVSYPFVCNPVALNGD